MTDSSTALSIFLALSPVFAALLAFILLQTVGERLQRRRQRVRGFEDLILEFDQNLQYQLVSTYITLEEEAYKRFRQAGFLLELNDTLRTPLTRLYARIHEKNELLVYFTAAVGTGKPLENYFVTAGTGVGPESERLVIVIARIRQEIDNEIGRLRPMVEREYNRAKDP